MNFRHLVIAGSVLVALVGCNGNAVQGNGNARTELRTVPTFHAIQAGGGVTVQIVVGAAQGVSVTADDNILPLIRTEVQGDRLIVEPRRSVHSTTPIVVAVTATELSELQFSGGVHATATGLNQVRLALRASGGVDLTASGTVETLDLNFSGGVQAHIESIVANSVMIHASGGVSANVHAAKSISGSISGGTTVTVTGGARGNGVTTSGGATVTYR